MPLIPVQPDAEEKDALSLRLDRSLHECLKQYAEFIQSSKDYVISQALRRLFRKDKEFVTWVGARAAALAASRPLDSPATTDLSTNVAPAVRTSRQA